MDFLGPGGVPAPIDLNEFSLPEFYLSSSTHLLAQPLAWSDLAGFNFTQRPMAMVSKRKLSKSSLAALQNAFRSCWDQGFVGGVYPPKIGQSKDQEQHSGNGMRGQRFYQKFEVSRQPDGALEIRWPDLTKLSSEELKSFNPFVRVSEALNEAICLTVWNIKRAKPKTANHMTVSVVAMELWGDLKLLEQLSPAGYTQAITSAKEGGYDIEAIPFNKTGGPIHNDGTKLDPGLQSLMVIGMHPQFQGGETYFYSWNGKSLGPVVGKFHLEPGEQGMWAVGTENQTSAHLAGPFCGGYRQILASLVETDSQAPNGPRTSYGFEERDLSPQNTGPDKS